MPQSDSRTICILGVDPGTLVTGYGVIESRQGRLRMLTSGAIRNADGTPMAERLKRIFDSLDAVICRTPPDEMAIETAFYGKNAQSALKLGHARGVAMLSAVQHGIPVHEYSPREVKKAITGNGSATKQQVQFMVLALLQPVKRPPLFDITDALAVAIAHLHRRQSGRATTQRNWKAFIAAHPERVSVPLRTGAV
jgi:crossover junction endodeoxyribonuclease RuvC